MGYETLMNFICNSKTVTTLTSSNSRSFANCRYSPLKSYHPIESQRRMERYAIDHEGYVAPYAETQLTLEEFNEMFNFQLENYRKLRKEFDCEKAFPHVYEKISKLGRN